MFDKVSSHMVHRCTNLRDMGRLAFAGLCLHGVCMVLVACENQHGMANRLGKAHEESRTNLVKKLIGAFYKSAPMAVFIELAQKNRA